MDKDTDKNIKNASKNIMQLEAYNYLKSSTKLKWCSIDTIVENTLSENPYRSHSYRHRMWKEQCMINFPILYLSSIYLYMYAKRRNIDTFLFATRDCCHFYKIFSKLFPNEKAHYFNCSRVMFEGATSQENIFFNNYVKSLIVDDKDIDNNISKYIEKSIYVDIHGTGKRVFGYFEKQFDNVPHCFMLSATHKKYGKFPLITQNYVKKNKFVNIVFNARGGPIEMLNYELIGTLRDYTESGPERDPSEYDIKLVKPYHTAMAKIISNIKSFDELIKYDKNDCNKYLVVLDRMINKLFVSVQDNLPIISSFIEHASNHRTVGVNNKTNHLDNNKIKLNDVLSTKTIYGIIWNGIYDGNNCIIKIMLLDDSNNNTNNTNNINKINDIDINILQYFTDKKLMDYDSFIREVQGLTNLDKVGLGPKFFGYSVQTDNDGNIYGFLVMEKIDCSLKDLFSKRNLNHDEITVIETAIRKLHTGYGIVHGDLKPSNIGIYLDNKHKVKKCVFFDCPKIKYEKDYDKKMFNELIEKDIKNYGKHILLNLKELQN